LQTIVSGKNFVSISKAQSSAKDGNYDQPYNIASVELLHVMYCW